MQPYHQALKSGTILCGSSYTYRIESVLAQGSFGITYLATIRVKVQGALGELKTDTQIAVKEFFLKEMNIREATDVVAESSQSNLMNKYGRKFLKEAENLFRLHHPKLVEIASRNQQEVKRLNRKSKQKRLVKGVLGMAVGVMLAVFICFIARQKGTPDTNPQAQRLAAVTDSIVIDRIAADSRMITSITPTQPVVTELSKYPAHQPVLKQWIGKSNVVLKEITPPPSATPPPTAVTVKERRPQPTSNEPSLGKLIDLGLSVKWASYNVGASSPEGYGGLYGWADPTGEKTSTNLDDYPSSNPPRNICGTPYDIARAKWGGSWRLPKQEEFAELDKRCDWKWLTYKGVTGYLVTGPNGNRIFLPAAGWRLRDGGADDRGSRGYYWSGSLKLSTSGCGFYFTCDYRNPSGIYYYRHLGQSIRPVSD